MYTFALCIMSLAGFEYRGAPPPLADVRRSPIMFASFARYHPRIVRWNAHFSLFALSDPEKKKMRRPVFNSASAGFGRRGGGFEYTSTFRSDGRLHLTGKSFSAVAWHSLFRITMHYMNLISAPQTAPLPSIKMSTHIFPLRTGGKVLPSTHNRPLRSNP